MQIRNTIVGQLHIYRWNTIHIIANVSGQTEANAETWTLIILGYIVLLLLLMFIHSKLLKRQKKTHENVVILYDTCRYQVAKAQYESREVQDTKGINSVIDADHKNYLTNAKAIKQEILSIEDQLGQEIISPDQRKTIEKQTKNKNRLTISVQSIWWIITVFTIGIYKVFW